MQINVTGRHVDITDTIRSYAQDKVEDMLSEFPRVQSAHIILEIEKYRHLAEVVVQVAGHGAHEAKSETENMYASIDMVVEKMERQLRKLRDKVQKHKGVESLAQLELDAQREEE